MSARDRSVPPEVLRVRVIVDPEKGPMGAELQQVMLARCPYFQTVVGEVQPDVIRAELGPGGTVRIEQRFPATGAVDRLVEGDGWIAHICALRPPMVRVDFAAVDPQRLQEVAEHFEGIFPRPAPEPSSVTIAFLFEGHGGARARVQRMRVQPWEEVAANYPSRTHRPIEQLLRASRPATDGRLVLLHGPPGTGKSHLLRTLAWEWSNWAETFYVTDPERLFASGEYLHSLLDQHPGGDKWMLVIIEDAAELLGETATSPMHPGLAKLLNLGDGLLGEAHGLVIAITTNEPLRRIHPAITRPGRCLANLELDGFTRDEARHRLDGAELPAGDRLTLAQIMEIEQQRAPIVTAPEAVSAGLYL